MKHVFNVLFLFPIVLTIASCGRKAEAAKATISDVIPVKVMNLDKQNNTAPIAVSGQFTTDDEVYLSFKTGGIIDHLYAKEGDMVHKGQVLASVNLTEIQAQVQQANLGFEKATRDYKRTQNLYKDSVATLEQLQNTRTMLDMAQQQLTAAQYNLNYSQIRATEDGYILHKMASEGQNITSGTPVFQINGAQSHNWLLRVGVSDKQWETIRINDKATITYASNTNKNFEGTVYHRSAGADPATGSFIIDIKLTGEKPSAIAAGMFGSATIIPGNNTAAQYNNGWAIPYDALLDGDGNSGYVFVTNDNKVANRIKVTIEGIEKDRVLISDGLQNAKELIVSGSAYLTENSPIRIIQ